jgi:peptide/nickel transport system substrate-binding protein
MTFAVLYGPADPDWFLGTLFKEKSPPWGFDAPDLFRAVNEANTELDPGRRKDRYEDVHRRVMEMLPGVPLVHVPSALALSKAVRGYRASPAAPVDDLTAVSLR